MHFLWALTCLSTMTFAAVDESWKSYSDPEILSPNYQNKLSSLPLNGNIEDGKIAWSGDYWATQKGGINYRWNTPAPVGFKYDSPTKAQVMRMSPEELATLAPSEKFDLLNGFYDYPLKRTVEASTKKSAADWAGICHGWAPATLHHVEPYAKTLTNPDGVLIPFGSADIKAIVSYYYAFVQEYKTTYQMGLRCFTNIGLGRGCNDDLNAGAFHITIANRLAINKQGFLADIERFKEVWNQPIVGYESQILETIPPSKKASKEAVKEVRVKTELKYIDEADASWGTNLGTDSQKFGILELQYRVELNNRGEIIGGTWESGFRPDFLWYVHKEEIFKAPYQRLSELLND